MALAIRLYGDPVLREKAKAIGEIGEEIEGLAGAMIETMREGDGIGLAATQVGRLVRLVVADGKAFGDDEGARVFVNPEIARFSRSRSLYEEGCLSLPDVRADVERSDRIVLRSRDLEGEESEEELEGLPARVLQHEIDHLDGRLFIDHLGTARLNLLRKRLREIRRLAARENRASS